MSDIKNLNSYLKILQIFCFQFFSLLSLNFKTNKLSFASKGYAAYFVVRIGLLFASLFYLWLHYYKNFQSASIRQNVFGYILKIAAALLSWFRAFNSIVESFVKIKSNQEFFINLNNFSETIKEQLNVEINLKKFEKILIRRQVYILVFASFLTANDIMSIKNVSGFGIFYQIFVHFMSHMVSFLILYKLCFYIDTICICLMTFYDNLDVIASADVHSSKLLRKIYALKNSYFFIIEMTAGLNHFMYITISTYITFSFVWLVTRLYQILIMWLDETKRGDKMTGRCVNY